MKNSLSVNVLDLKGEKLGRINLPKEIFAAKINESLMAQAVRVYLTNQRQGTSSTKTRGEVTGSRRKIWRQKGTGRARHGDRYAPLFVGGGIAHGPKIRNFNFTMSKKMRRRALFSALTSKFKDKAIVVLDGLEKIKPKTKEMIKVMEQGTWNLEHQRILLVLPSKIDNVSKAGRNIPYLTLKEASLLNTYEVLKHNRLVFMKEAIPVLKQTFAKLN